MPKTLMPLPTMLTRCLSSRNGRSLRLWTLDVFANCWPYPWFWMEEVYIPLKRCPRLDSLITVWAGLMEQIGFWILPCRMEHSNYGQHSEIRKNLYDKTLAISLYFFTLRKQKRETLTYLN